MAENTASRSKSKNNLKKAYVGTIRDFGTHIATITGDVLSPQAREAEIARHNRERNRTIFDARGFNVDELMSENKDFSIALSDHYYGLIITHVVEDDKTKALKLL